MCRRDFEVSKMSTFINNPCVKSISLLHNSNASTVIQCFPPKQLTQFKQIFLGVGNFQMPACTRSDGVLVNGCQWVAKVDDWHGRGASAQYKGCYIIT